ncbi:MAG: hypothetical protein ACK5Y2_14150 [Bdellovibrionales bacterium]
MRHWSINDILNLQQKLRHTSISPAEFTAQFLLKRPLHFQRKPLQLPSFHCDPQARAQVQPNSNFLADQDTMTFLHEFHWKGYSDRIRRALLMWHTGRYPLQLSHEIPSPLELLRLQAQGQRVVTVLVQPEQWDQLHHGHSAWDFTVHDLLHADHFFEKEDWRQGQISFYRFLLERWELPEIQALHGDPQFDYLIADMNSHPRHLFGTFQALVLKSWKQRKGLAPQQNLAPTDEQTFQDQVRHWQQELSDCP